MCCWEVTEKFARSHKYVGVFQVDRIEGLRATKCKRAYTMDEQISFVPPMQRRKKRKNGRKYWKDFNDAPPHWHTRKSGEANSKANVNKNQSLRPKLHICEKWKISAHTKKKHEKNMVKAVPWTIWKIYILCEIGGCVCISFFFRHSFCDCKHGTKEK